MKNEIKELYKKDKKLAIQVDNALGFKIKAANTDNQDDLKKALDSLSEKINSLSESLDIVDNVLKVISKGKIPSKIDEAGKNILTSLAKYRKLIKNYIKFEVK